MYLRLYNYFKENIVEFVDVVQNDSAVYIFTELINGHSLKHHITNHNGINNDEAKSIFSQICGAVKVTVVIVILVLA